MRLWAAKNMAATVAIKDHFFRIQTLATNAQSSGATKVEPFHFRTAWGVKHNFCLELKGAAQAAWSLCIRHLTFLNQTQQRVQK